MRYTMLLNKTPSVRECDKSLQDILTIAAASSFDGTAFGAPLAELLPVNAGNLVISVNGGRTLLYAPHPSTSNR